MRTIFAFLFCVGIFLPMSAWSGDAGRDQKKLNGVWRALYGELGGKKLPAELVQKVKLTLNNGKYTVESAGNVDKGTYKISPGKSPKEIDIVGNKGAKKKKRVILGIYEFKNGQLRVCYDLEGKNRPKKFGTKGKQAYFYAEYQRAEK